MKKFAVILITIRFETAGTGAGLFALLFSKVICLTYKNIINFAFPKQPQQ